MEDILRPAWWLNTTISRKFWLEDKTESGIVKGTVCRNATAGADWDEVFEHLYHLLGESGIKKMLGGTYMQVWSSGDSFWKSVLSFHHSQTQVLRLGNKHPSHQTILLAQENIVFNLEDNTTLTSDKTTILHFKNASVSKFFSNMSLIHLILSETLKGRYSIQQMKPRPWPVPVNTAHSNCQLTRAKLSKSGILYYKSLFFLLSCSSILEKLNFSNIIIIYNNKKKKKKMRANLWICRKKWLRKNSLYFCGNSKKHIIGFIEAT